MEVKQCQVNKCKAFEDNDVDSVDNFTNPDESGCESNIKFWEVETDSLSSQITDVQGRLKKNLKFWKEVLKAPDTVLEYTYREWLPPSVQVPSSFPQPVQ